MSIPARNPAPEAPELDGRVDAAAPKLRAARLNKHRCGEQEGECDEIDGRVVGLHKRREKHYAWHAKGKSGTPIEQIPVSP